MLTTWEWCNPISKIMHQGSFELKAVSITADGVRLHAYPRYIECTRYMTGP